MHVAPSILPPNDVKKKKKDEIEREKEGEKKRVGVGWETVSWKAKEIRSTLERKCYVITKVTWSVRYETQG